MVRTTLMGALSLVCCSCAISGPSFPPGDRPPRMGEEIRIQRPSFMIRIRERGNVEFYPDTQAIPNPDFRISIKEMGYLYYTEGLTTWPSSIECEYSIDAETLDVSSLAAYINKACLPAECSVSIPGSSGTTLELNESCPYQLVIVVKKTSWMKSAGISLTLSPGESADLADANTSPFVGTFSVVE